MVSIPSSARARTRRALRAGAVLLLVAGLGGCATYSARIADLRPELANGEFDAALETIEEETGGKDQLLYFLERGIVLHYADRWTESNTAFAAAERVADDLYTKSVSEGALSLITNDMSISYRARPFELAMVPYYKALNYSYLGDRNAAQVEARRASLQMSKYVAATLDGVREEDRDALERIRNNAFLLYTSGMLYDWDGEINDAFTAYRNAAFAYQRNAGLLDVTPPPTLATDLVRVSRRLGFQSELEQLRKACPDVFRDASVAVDGPRTRESYAPSARWRSGDGEVVLFLESGWVAQKTQVRIDFPVFEGEAYSDASYWAWEIYAGMGNMQALVSGRKVEYWVSIAVPEMPPVTDPVGTARVLAVPADSLAAAASDRPVSVAATRVENLSRHARITFEAELPTIFFKTILRGLTKYLASRGAEEAGGGWAKLAANIFGAATESADTRSWLTLPSEVHLARISLPAGTWDLEIDITGPGGRPLGRRTIRGVEVTAGDWAFHSYRVF